MCDEGPRALNRNWEASGQAGSHAALRFRGDGEAGRGQARFGGAYETAWRASVHAQRRRHQCQVLRSRQPCLRDQKARWPILRGTHLTSFFIRFFIHLNDRLIHSSSPQMLHTSIYLFMR